MAGILGKRRLRRTRVSGRRRFAALGTIGFGGLTAALLASTSTGAIAACAPTPTAGDDIVECHDANPTAVQLLGGNDSLTIDDGAVIGNTGGTTTIIDGGIDNDHIVVNGGLINGNTTGGDGNDRIEVNGGVLHGSVQGGNNDDTIIIRGGLIDGTNATHTNGSVNAGAGNDRIIIYDGTVTGEFQNGAGTDFTIMFGGTIMGTVEMQRGAVNSIIVVDGAELLSGFEMQNPNATFGLALNPTFYLRSGFVGVGRWGNANDSTFIIDPINSLDPDSFDIDAVDIEAAFAAAAKNPEEHMLVIGEGGGDDDDDDDAGGSTIAFGNGNDTVMFIGARNNGDAEMRNLHFGERDEDEEEPPVFDGDGQPATPTTFGLPGTPGDADRFSVAFGSDLLLGDIVNFEIFEVTQASNVVLTGEEYEFEDSVTVDGTSQVAFTESEVELETDHLSLGAPDANAPATFNAGDQYTAFAPGGVLQFGLVIEDEDDDDDDDDRRFDDDDDDVEEVEEAGPGVFAIEVGDDTFENGGTVSTLNNVAGDVLTIAGHYEADFGRIALDAYIGATGSEADKIVFDGEVDGTTTIYVNNVNEGGGEATGNGEEDGILILESETGEITEGSFQLAENRYTGNREVIAGAYAYRLALFGDSGRLQSEVRGDVAALSAGVTVGLRQGLAGSDTVQKRMGEIRQGDTSAAGNINEGVWLRGKFSDYFVTARAGTGFDRQSQSVIGGFDSSLDAGRNGRIDLGIFGGYTNTLARFDTTAFGAANVTTIGVRGLTVGGYATWHRLSDVPGAGPYADVVGRVDLLNFGMGALNAPATATSRGTTISASAETGYGFALANAFVLQPQAQLIYSASRQNAFNDAFGVRVTPGAGTSLVGRAGLQVQTSFMTSGGLPISPYLIGNVMSEFMGRTTTNVGGTNFTQDLGGTWFNIGGGISAALTERSKLYASGEYNLGAVRGWGATAGVKIGW